MSTISGWISRMRIMASAPDPASPEHEPGLGGEDGLNAVTDNRMIVDNHDGDGRGHSERSIANGVDLTPGRAFGLMKRHLAPQ